MASIKQVLDWMDSDEGRSRFPNRQNRYFLSGLYRRAGEDDMDSVVSNWGVVRQLFYPHINDHTSSTYHKMVTTILNAFNKKEPTDMPSAPPTVSPKSTVSEVYAWCVRNRRRCRASATAALVTYRKTCGDMVWSQFLERADKIMVENEVSENTRRTYISKFRSVDRAIQGLPPARPSVPMTRKKRKKTADATVQKAETPKVRMGNAVRATLVDNSLSSFDSIRSRLAVRRQILEVLSTLPKADQHNVLIEALVEVESRVN